MILQSLTQQAIADDSSNDVSDEGSIAVADPTAQTPHQAVVILIAAQKPDRWRSAITSANCSLPQKCLIPYHARRGTRGRVQNFAHLRDQS